MNKFVGVRDGEPVKFCELPKHHFASIIFEAISVILVAAGAMLGYICGSIFNAKSLLGVPLTTQEIGFNWNLAITIWIGCFLYLILLIGVTIIIRNQEKIMDR